MSSRRKLEALRNLAERPGTEAEGKLAREMLAKLEAKRSPAEGAYHQFERFLHTGTLDDLADACGPHVCDCGTKYPSFTKCWNQPEHFRIRVQITQMFAKGDRVYYNRWAYKENQPATVIGYCVKEDLWAWIRLKFDDLKQPRAVPIKSAKGWHLSKQPLDREAIRLTDLRDGMHRFDGTG